MLLFSLHCQITYKKAPSSPSSVVCFFCGVMGVPRVSRRRHSGIDRETIRIAIILRVTLLKEVKTMLELQIDIFRGVRVGGALFAQAIVLWSIKQPQTLRFNTFGLFHPM